MKGRSEIRNLTDFDLGIAFLKAYDRYEHLRRCRGCRRKAGFLGCIRAGLELSRLRSECDRRQFTVEILDDRIDVILKGQRSSVYEIPDSVN